MHGARPTALVVDDDVVLQRTFAELLADEGFESTGVGSVDAALTVLASHQPDVILLDSRLGSQSGAELLITLRRDGKEIPPVVFLSATPSDGAVAAELAVPFLTKPCRLGALVEAVRTAVAARVRAR